MTLLNLLFISLALVLEGYYKGIGRVSSLILGGRILPIRYKVEVRLELCLPGGNNR